MSIKNFLFAGIILSILFFFCDFAWHQLIFSAFYHVQQEGIARAKPQYLIFGLGDIYRGFIFALVYFALVKKPSSLIHGFIFGLGIGFLLASVNSLHFAMLKINSMQWIWYESTNLIVQSVVAGLILPFFAMGRKRVNSEQT